MRSESGPNQISPPRGRDESANPRYDLPNSVRSDAVDRSRVHSVQRRVDALTTNEEVQRTVVHDARLQGSRRYTNRCDLRFFTVHGIEGEYSLVYDTLILVPNVASRKEEETNTWIGYDGKSIEQFLATFNGYESFRVEGYDVRLRSWRREGVGDVCSTLARTYERGPRGTSSGGEP